MPSVMLRLDKGIGRLPYLAAGVVLFAIKIAIDSQLAQASVHRCFFTTGSFIEPIEIWDPPRELRFGVSASPDPMTEWTLWDGRAAVREADSSTGTLSRFRSSVTGVTKGIVRLRGACRRDPCYAGAHGFTSRGERDVPTLSFLPA